MIQYDETIFLDPWRVYQQTHGNDVITNPGSPRFLHIMKRFSTVEPLKEKRGKYFQTWGYQIPKKSFVRAFMEYQNEVIDKRSTWNKQNDLIKLIAILQECFYRNHNAKTCQKRWARSRSYNKKGNLLREAIIYATRLTFECRLDDFSWGKQFDDTKGYPIILYFQFGPFENEDQVSFHCNDFEEVQDFSGKWIGHEQKKCPTIARYLKLHRETKIPCTDTQVSIPILTEQEVNLRIAQNQINDNWDADFTIEEADQCVAEDLAKEALEAKKNQIQPELMKETSQTIIRQKQLNEFWK